MSGKNILGDLPSINNNIISLNQRISNKSRLTNYCYAGEGEVVDLATGVTHALRPGTLYALDRHDAHILRATRGDLRLVCVFNPPLAGDETHDASGSYGPRE